MRGASLALAARVVSATLLALGAHERVAMAAGDVATAQVLFEEGKRLMAEARYAEACPKLGQSQRLAPAVGTEFNLADCWEHAGRLASAWAAFLDVVDQTHKRGETMRETAARARVEALVARLGKLAIQVPSTLERLSDLEVRRDGELVPREAWGVALPVDAGDHRVEVRASSRLAWTGSVHTVDAGVASMFVPELAPAPLTLGPPLVVPPSTAGASQVVDATQTSSPDHTAALVVLGSAVLFAGVGVVGLIEHSANVSDYNGDPSCPSIGAATRPGRCDGYVSAASTWTTVGILGFVASGVAAVTGLTLWVTAPSHPVALSVSLACGVGVSAVSCTGAF